MKNISYKFFFLALISLLMVLFVSCSSTVDADEVYDDYVGDISIPNLGNKESPIHSISLSVNEGMYANVNGSGKVVIVYKPQFEGDHQFEETYLLEFSGTFDKSTREISGLVKVTGGGKCTLNCEGVDDYVLDHSSYWKAKVENGITKITGGMISAYPDFSTNYFTFEAHASKD